MAPLFLPILLFYMQGTFVHMGFDKPYRTLDLCKQHLEQILTNLQEGKPDDVQIVATCAPIKDLGGPLYPPAAPPKLKPNV